MDIEKVAHDTPEKIATIKVDYGERIALNHIEKILEPFNFDDNQKKRQLN